MRAALLCLAGLLAATGASATTLYEAPISNVTPDSSPWNWIYDSVPSGAVVTAPGGSGFVTLDTSASMGISAGWLKVGTPILDRTVGYDATWNLKVLSESHNADNQRAGLSVIVLGSDHEGVEFGFWDNEIFAYNSDANFTPGESALLDTTAGMRNYDLQVFGSGYTLFVDGTAELSGSLRNYSFAGPPYTFANTVWVGDDTSRGESVSELQSFAVTPAPEPTTWIALGAGIVMLRKRRKRVTP